MNGPAFAPVAPYAGAWIEISYCGVAKSDAPVAPYAGAWIEMHIIAFEKLSFQVAPYAGAWIEISRALLTISPRCRTLRGCVD